MAVLARSLALPLLVVVGSKLGAINHALLTCEAARARGLELRGYAVSFPAAAAGLAAETNVEILHELLGPPLAVLPWQAGGLDASAAGRAALARLFEDRFDFARLGLG
jgi:dethiobiotin synthetase